jgi:hypothetical protein
MVVKPPMTPNSTPVTTPGCGASRSKRVPSQCRSTKAPAMSPIASRICAADKDAANSPATPMPAAMLGIMIFRFHGLQSRR